MSLTSTYHALRAALRRHRKLVLVAAAILLPVFLLSAVAVNFCVHDIAVAKKELTGTAYLRRAWAMVSACDARQSATAWNAVPFGTGVKPRPRLDAMGQALEVELARTPVQSETCAHARTFLDQIADDTGLTLDPRPDSYYLMELVVTNLPALSGRSAGLEQAFGRDPQSAHGQGALTFGAGALRDALQTVTASVADASHGADGSVQVATAVPLVRLSDSIQRYAEAAEGASVGLGDKDMPARARGMVREVRGATDSLWVVGVNQLERLLARRIAAARLTLWATLAGAAALTVLAIMALVWYDLYTQREEVMQLNDSLRQSNEELERFAYICSHDMQEPVRMMSLYAEMLMEDAGERLDEADRRHVDFIVRNSRVMKTMISDILRFSRVGRDPVEFYPVDSEAILKDVLLELAPEIERLNARVTFSGLPAFRTNPTLVRLLFQNLVGNALKFQTGARAPEIAVSAEEGDKAWRFEVRDNGIGIDERYRDEVFAIFRRLHTRDEFPGNGIGLSTCRKFLGLVGGAIDFTSVPGEGTTFTFILPEARLGGQ
ncbi:sensor histidine kinase [Asticcacaulis solisilvae]|uniref:sensor histidine kinase n=1 Tax=Asticcacaulis solisilvae TaxID=1217274 RepID=UPI003FD86FCB